MSDQGSDTSQDQASNGSDQREEPKETDQQRYTKLALRSSVWKHLCETRGQRYIDNRLDNYLVSCPGQQAAVDALKEYAADYENRFAAGENIILLGPVGTGKDHLAFAMAHAAVASFRTVLWISGADLWMAYREAMKNEGHDNELVSWCGTFTPRLSHCSESGVTSKLSTADVLVLSDPLPPSGALTDWQAEKLIQIVDRRYSHMLPTYLTINVANRAEAEQRMGAASVDRLAHGALVITCNWESYRKAGSKPQ